MSDWRHAVIDLTNDDSDADDSDKHLLGSLPLATGPPASQHVPMLTSSRLPNAPQPVPTRPAGAYTNPATPHIGLSRSSGMASIGRDGATNHSQMPRHVPVYIGTERVNYAERAPKRLRTEIDLVSSTPRTPNVPAQSRPSAQQVDAKPQSRAFLPNDNTHWNAGAQSRAPSAQDINQALKSNAGPTPVLGNVDTKSPRTLHIGRTSPTIPFAPNGPVSKHPAQTLDLGNHVSATAHLKKKAIPRIASGSDMEATGHSSKRKNVTNSFNTAQDHFLIFLKEVKQLRWSDITTEFNKHMPYRQYHTLQSRYSTVLNKRDRSQDPPTLILPPQFAAEANVSWEYVHPHPFIVSSKAPKPSSHFTTPRYNAREQTIQNPQSRRPPIQQTEHNYSSGTESAPRRERTRRTQRVNYEWPRQRGVVADVLDDMPDAAVQEIYTSDDAPTRSESPQEEDISLPSKAVAVDNVPVDVDFDVEDAKLGLSLRRKALCDTPAEIVPYLTFFNTVSIWRGLGPVIQSRLAWSSLTC
ncbi:Rik1-associated factor 1 [Pyrenophora seminiperda CCB06]|uniref:Rik1-associated factor 1 n=1 Tax=Pyrenophora seminiperda CCB06 TaxID=1302712 RepID=A0A3M7LY50_9PLEO|nr:Rik1-associated factor 1 [Pyrenophora seminiperda CCB06]